MVAVSNKRAGGSLLGRVPSLNDQPSAPITGWPSAPRPFLKIRPIGLPVRLSQVYELMAAPKPKPDEQTPENVTPLVPHNGERAGENILFHARIRSQIAKRKGDALGDLDDRDPDNAARIPVPQSQALVGVGGELVPAEIELKDTVEAPDLVTADASRERLQQLQWAGVLETGLDAADTIGAKNSFEKMHAHQMALLHRLTMKLGMRLEDMQHYYNEWTSQQKNVEQCRVINSIARLTSVFQQGLLVLPRLRSGGSQTVHVHHHHQNVQVNEGGQALVAGKMKAGGRSGVSTRGKRQK